MKFKRNILLIMLVLSSSFSFAQLDIIEEPKKVVIKQFNNNKSLEASMKGNDTTYYFFFHNQKYTHITDMTSIAFYNKAEMNQFFEIAQKAKEEMKRITTKRYSINGEGVFLYLYNEENKKYTSMSSFEFKKMKKAFDEFIGQ